MIIVLSIQVHSNFPCAVAVFPYYFLGLSVPESFVESNIAQMITLINNIESETLTSKFIIYTVLLLQSETG